MKEVKVKGRGYLRKVWGFVFGHVCMNALDEQVYVYVGELSALEQSEERTHTCSDTTFPAASFTA